MYVAGRDRNFRPMLVIRPRILNEMNVSQFQIIVNFKYSLGPIPKMVLMLARSCVNTLKTIFSYLVKLRTGLF
jgi:hypothetical protein